MSRQILEAQPVEKVGKIRNLIQLASHKMKVKIEDRDIFIIRISPYNGAEDSDGTVYLFAVQGTPLRLHGSLHKYWKADVRRMDTIEGWRLNTDKRKLFISEEELTEWRFKK